MNFQRLRLVAAAPLERLSGILFPDAHSDLTVNFYTGLTLLGGCLALIVFPINYLLSLPLLVTFDALGFSLFSFWLYGLARRGVHRPALLFIGLLAGLNFAWFPNGGVTSSIPYYFFLPLLYPLVIWGGAHRWTAIGVVFVNVLALMWLSLEYPQLSTPFPSYRALVTDLASGFVVCGLGVIAMLWIVTSGYHRERDRLKAANEALGESRAQFSRLFEANPNALHVVDLRTKTFVDVNDGFVRLTGWDKADVVGQQATDIDLWFDLADRQRLYDRLQRDGRVSGLVARLRRRDGGVVWASMSATHVGGEHPWIIGSTLDVTEQVEADRRVAESQALLSTLIDSTDDLVWLVEPTAFGLVAFNEAFASALAEHPGIVARVGLGLDDIMPPSMAEEWRSYYRRALEGGPFTFEYTVEATGQVLLHSLSPVRHGEETIGVSAFSKNITAQKHAEVERDRLEVQVLEAQKMESLGSLAGGVAHDFNNMLSGIMGYADLLLEGEAHPTRRAQLEAILNAARRSGDLTRKLLAFGRRGKNIVESVDMNTVVRDSLTMLRPSFGQYVCIDLQCHATWPVDGDPSQLNQLVVNLCINANEAMPKGGTLTLATADVTLDAAAASEAGVPAGQYVRLRVADTGVGIPEAIRPHIFEPFFTTKASGKTSGTGLGLSTVYGIVHLHHGTVAVESAPGRGAAFTILVPRGELAPQHKAATPETERGQGLFLVVEDEELVREFTRDALEHLGYRTITANDGDEAVHVFRERHRDLAGVVLDLKMPHKSGTEAFIEIRAIDANVPVLICSGYADNEEAQALITLGARGLLAKPFRLSALADEIARLH